jgi:hypothetical protein
MLACLCWFYWPTSHVLMLELFAFIKLVRSSRRVVVVVGAILVPCPSIQQQIQHSPHLQLLHAALHHTLYRALPP